MSVVLFADEFRCAIYEEAPGGGAAIDPNAPMNRPLLDPLGWLGNVYFHSDLNYFGIAARNMNAVINHAAIPGLVRQAGSAGESSAVVKFYGQAVTTSHNLVTHNLGYAPRFFCIYDGKLIPHGAPIQQEAGNRRRFVTAYATSTEIRLFEVANSQAEALPAATRTYQVIVFRDPAASPTTTPLHLAPGVADFGRGKFRGGEPHLRADGQGDVLWPIATSRTAAVRNGGLRAFYPAGGYIDFYDFDGSLPAPSYLTTSAGV